MMYKKLILLFLASLLMVSCTEDIEKPVRVSEVENAPEIPRNLLTRVGDGEVELSWTVSAPGTILRYFIYRAEDLERELILIDSSLQMSYTDTALRNGTNYLYAVSSLGDNNLESDFSTPVPAMPAIFSIAINNGNKYTSSENVTINTFAPSGTRYMMFANDPLFTDGVWINFANSRNWLTERGDGEKIVYAKFRDANGSEMTGFVSDEIVLDSRAVILLVSENSGGSVLSAGDVLHLTLDADEAEGSAKMIVPEFGDVKLYDDGTLGDQVADDGVYERDLLIPASVDVIDGVITGVFTDAAGNPANNRDAETVINIANPPAPSVLNAFIISETEIELVWSKSPDSDFSNYLLFRDSNSGVDINSTLIENDNVSNNTNHTDDDGLEPSSDYYYVLYTFDRSGLTSKSNVVKATTKANVAPESVSLFISNSDSTSVSLGWTKNNDDDFESYRIYRSVTSPVATTDDNLRGVQASQGSISFTDNDIEVGEVFYYVVVVVDEFGLTAKSNEVSGPN